MMTSRELVAATLEFRNNTGRVPRKIDYLPWAVDNHPGELERIMKEFPDDFGGAYTEYAQRSISKGHPYEIGEYMDDWGCVFSNIHRGVIGEVKNPLVSPDDDGWDDTSKVHIPEEWLSFNTDMVNKSCAESDKFIWAGACPRPFEQLQFIRGTEQLYMDLADPPKKMMEFIEKLHDFYCRLLEKWASTDVDGLLMMDDWGSQNTLLIHPETWKAIFKPLYRDYINIAHKHGKKMFMHSDGNILLIYPELIDLGLDALNSQIFCMGIDNLARYKGEITFWGEIDRQNLLPHGTVDDIRRAVEQVKSTLWSNGGCIAQCEFGPSARPENVYEVFASWNRS